MSVMIQAGVTMGVNSRRIVYFRKDAATVAQGSLAAKRLEGQRDNMEYQTLTGAVEIGPYTMYDWEGSLVWEKELIPFRNENGNSVSVLRTHILKMQTPDQTLE